MKQKFQVKQWAMWIFAAVVSLPATMLCAAMATMIAEYGWWWDERPWRR